MKVEEIRKTQPFRQPSGLRGARVPTLAAMEGALVELRDLDWRYRVRSRRLGYSSFATDIPTRLIQRQDGDVAGDYSYTLMTNRAGKEVVMPKVDSRRPRTSLSTVEVRRMEELFGWLELVPEVLDRRIIWAASFHLWRGEAIDWAGMKWRLAYAHSRERLSRRYREVLAKLICRINGVPTRHFRLLLVREGVAFADLLDR